jgi:3-methylfumaryl-CoA hydratase
MSHYQDWIGRRTERTETITERQLSHFRATFAGLLASEPVPLGFHWCLVPDVAQPADLGRDGHPRTGLFLPSLPLPRRMWAGGEVMFHGAFSPGETVTRTSTVADIAFKTGRTGRLGFVTVDHVYAVDGATRITERQDIVYREDPRQHASAPSPPPAEDWAAETHWRVTPDTVLLFRYSALTFNGHRIHYDQAYATAVEGYSGLVVHGPMQATWMLNLAAEVLGRAPASVRYRGLTPLICHTPVRVEARSEGDVIEMRVRRDDGIVTAQASAVA